MSSEAREGRGRGTKESERLIRCELAAAIVKRGASKLKQILEEGERSGRARHAIKQKRKKRTQRKRCAKERFLRK